MMIARIALILGGDERALRIARKAAQLYRDLDQMELYRWLQRFEEVLAAIIASSRAA